jgi:hypothetical protein
MLAIMRSRIVSFQFAIQEHTQLQDMGVRFALHTGAGVTLEQSAEGIMGLREGEGEETNCTMRSFNLTDIIRVIK